MKSIADEILVKMFNDEDVEYFYHINKRTWYIRVQIIEGFLYVCDIIFCLVFFLKLNSNFIRWKPEQTVTRLSASAYPIYHT